MSDFDLPDLDPSSGPAQMPSPDRSGRPARKLSKPERAAIILGVLGTDSAAPILEQMDETCHRAFAGAMVRLEKIDTDTVEAVIREFIATLEDGDLAVSGGLDRAREMLSGVTNETVLADILDEADRPNARNAWDKLKKVDDDLLAEMLLKEHPQTSAVIVDRLPADKAAGVIGLLPLEVACRIVAGMNRASKLSAKVVEAIGQSVSRDFLARQSRGKRATPADKISDIMNYAAGQMRADVLEFLGRTEPELLEEVRKKMFTFTDIPHRIDRRNITAIVRATPNEVLLPALAGAAENAPETRDYFLSNISSRVAEQLTDELDDLGTVKLRVAEAAQSEIVKTIRKLVADGTLEMLEPEE